VELAAIIVTVHRVRPGQGAAWYGHHHHQSIKKPER
jgi:hypothetical protein